MQDCLFCKIARKDIPAHVIFENPGAIAFLDIHPVAKGHAVVIPRAHSGNVVDADDESLSGAILAVRETVKKLERALHPAGFTIGINHGEAAGQAVPHLHIHVIPRYSGDGGKSIHSIVSAPAPSDIAETYTLITQSHQ